MLRISTLFLLLVRSSVALVESDKPDKQIFDGDTLFLAWKQFTSIQRNQTLQFDQEFPVDDRLFSNLKQCRLGNAVSASMVHTLSISNISIYSEIGHQSTFCRPDVILLEYTSNALGLKSAAEMFRKSCLNSMQTQSSLPTLSKILKQTSPDLKVVESNSAHTNLQTWTKHVTRLITRVGGFENRWKLILIAPGLFDLRIGASAQTLSDDILQSVQIIKERLPSKTFVLISKNSQFSISRDAARTFSFCAEILSLWNLNFTQTLASWHILNARLKQNFQTDDFFVGMVDLLDGSMPLIFDKTPDVSILDVDCLHFSQRGLSLFGLHLYNFIVQPAKQFTFKPMVRPLVCPRPNCPYLVTPINRHFCLKPKTTRTYDKLEPETVYGLMFGCIVSLFFILFLYTICL